MSMVGMVPLRIMEQSNKTPQHFSLSYKRVETLGLLGRKKRVSDAKNWAICRNDKTSNLAESIPPTQKIEGHEICH
jgi:hypothetical protein